MVVEPGRLVVCVLVFTTAFVPVTGTASLGGTSPAVSAADTAGASIGSIGGSHGRPVAQVGPRSGPETDNTVTRIVVHENGSATWTLRIRTRLETNASAAEYRAFQERFRENTSQYLGDFRESITGAVGEARETTGREMRAEGFRASTSIQTIPRRWGIVTFEFQWVGFATTDGTRLRVGDVFGGGFFIAEGDSLEIVAPPEYRIQSADPSPDESGGGVVAWHGREDFSDGRPAVVYAPGGASESDSLPWPRVLGGAAVVGVAALSALGYRRFRGGGAGEPARTSREGSSGGPDESGSAGVLADEDHVRRLLAGHGGRMRQQAIAEELEWSRSKTSRVLGRMAEAGTVEKRQLGRENVIALVEDGGD